jgi:hypothetical protein
MISVTAKPSTSWNLRASRRALASASWFCRHHDVQYDVASCLQFAHKERIETKKIDLRSSSKDNATVITDFSYRTSNNIHTNTGDDLLFIGPRTRCFIGVE